MLAGIPIYYVTQRPSEGPIQGISSRKLRTDVVGSRGLLGLGFFANIAARVRGRPAPGAGWQAVATEGDEQVEMRTPVR